MSGLPQRGANGMGPLPCWADLELVIPQVVATMRRYLGQIGCVLRPGSVGGADLALRSFAAFLAEASPVTSLAQVTRRSARSGSECRPGTGSYWRLLTGQPWVRGTSRSATTGSK